jgi:DNA-binding SARP family transcriptional activator
LRGEQFREFTRRRAALWAAHAVQLVTGVRVLELGVLGPLTVVTGHGRVALAAAMPRRLLSVLTCRAGQQVPVDMLIDALWDADPPPTARKTLQVYVRRLRQALGDVERIHHHAASYQLVLRPGELDAHRFEDLAARARRAHSGGDLRCAGALFGEALGLWRGEPYADVTDLAVVADEATRLREQRLQAMEDRFEVDLELGRHAELVPELVLLARRHPYRERLRGHLLLALYRSGRQAEALGVFRETRAFLAEELGIEPGTALRALHEQILRADSDLDRPSGGVSTSRRGRESGPGADRLSRPVPRQLPSDVPAFTGRTESLAALDGLLPAGDRAPAGPVVVAAVAGGAGVGKTALAVHWAHRVTDRFGDGQLYVDLRGVAPTGGPTTPAEAVRGFLDAFAVSTARIPPGLGAQAALYRSLLADKRVLVVLDNARDAAQVRPLLPGGPGCLVVVTSRDQLTSLVAAEGAHPLTLAPLTVREARELLIRRLGPERAAAAPEAVEEIIARCAGSPCALAVVAARAVTHPQLPLDAVAAELSDGDLAAGTVELPPAPLAAEDGSAAGAPAYAAEARECLVQLVRSP